MFPGNGEYATEQNSVFRGKSANLFILYYDLIG